MSDSTESSAYFNRIILLVVDVGTETLRDTFYSKVPKKDVSVIFGTAPIQAELKRLNERRILTKAQYEKVTVSPDPDTYDISLLTTLLTNPKICGIPPPAKGWKVTPPDPSDFSVGADLLRLCQLRNDIIGHCNNAQLEATEFHKLWSNVETVLVRIAKYVGQAEETKIMQMVRYTETRELEPLYDRGLSVKVFSLPQEEDHDKYQTEVKTSLENLSLKGDTVTQKRQSSESAGGSVEKTFTVLKDDAFYRRILHESHRRFLLDLDPVVLLDFFLEENYLTYIQVPDIQEQRLTSDKTREILKAVGKRGANGYKTFRSLLIRSDQDYLAEYLDEQEAALEKEIEMAEKEKDVPYVQNVQTVSAHPELDYDNSLKGVQNIEAGTTISLPVNTSGIPNPSIAWFLDKEPIEKSARVTIETTDDKTTLTIKNTTFDDTGIYMVEAENNVGKAVANFEVNVRDKPSKPQNLAVSVMKDSIALEWQPPTNNGGCDITAYIIVIKKRDAKRNKFTDVEKVTGWTNKYTVQKLLEGNEYYFRVFAENKIGMGEPAEMKATIVTKYPLDILLSPQWYVPDSPKHLQATEVTKSSVTLTWEAPQKDGGSPITGYVLECCQLPGTRWVKANKKPIPDTMFTFPDLYENTEYQFRVSAVNAIGGVGKPCELTSPIRAKNPYDKPSAPGVPNVTEVTNTSGETMPETSFTAADLPEGELCEFRVTAENKAGLGKPSDVSEKVTIKAPIGGSWEGIIEESDWNMAETLLEQEVLPDKQQLRLICKTLGRKSDLVQKICRKICDNISGSIEGKVKVFPAVKPGEETDIIFVVTGKSISHEQVCDYSVEYHSGSAETKAAMAKRKQLQKPRQLTKSERIEEKTCINALEIEFFTKHKNLSVVESSPYRSKGYRDNNHKLIEEICIVLGVTVKGYIPIEEDELPTKIGKFGTDIREITVHKCKDGSPTSYHKSIKMNCVISREPQNRHESVHNLGHGTVGVFMSESDRSVREECLGSTCAHVLLVPKEMKKIQEDKRMWRGNENKPDIICNQPGLLNIANRCGRVKYALFTDDVDVVLFSPEETRLPTNGFFPGNCLQIAHQEMSFSDERFIDLDEEDEIYETPVLKMPGGGIADKITYGEILTSDSIICDNSENYQYLLKNQIEILSNGGLFSKSGDSGSCVFTNDDQSPLRAVGMVVADNSEQDGEDSRISYATPITQIIEAFRLQQIELSLKTFPADEQQEGQQRTTDMNSGTLVDNSSNHPNSFEEESVDEGASGEGLTKDEHQEDQQRTTDMKNETLAHNSSNHENLFQQECIDEGALGESLKKGKRQEISNKEVCCTISKCSMQQQEREHC